MIQKFRPLIIRIIIDFFVVFGFLFFLDFKNIIQCDYISVIIVFIFYIICYFYSFLSCLRRQEKANKINSIELKNKNPIFINFIFHIFGVIPLMIIMIYDVRINNFASYFWSYILFFFYHIIFIFIYWFIKIQRSLSSSFE
jgi:hypothetical protein